MNKLNSGDVLGCAFNCHRLIPQAQKCADDMTQNIRGMSEYWLDLGGNEFEKHCRDWVMKMNDLKNTLARIESGLLAYGHQLQQQEEAQRQAEVKRKADEKSAASLAAARPKATSKIK